MWEELYFVKLFAHCIPETVDWWSSFVVPVPLLVAVPGQFGLLVDYL